MQAEGQMGHVQDCCMPQGPGLGRGAASELHGWQLQLWQRGRAGLLHDVESQMAEGSRVELQ